jgi:hypothetical protein
MTVFGIKGSRMSREVLVNVVTSQVNIFNAMTTKLDAGVAVNPTPNPVYIREILDVYKTILASPKWSVSKVAQRVLGLPCSIGGENILPTPLVVELGFGVTHFDYKDYVDGDDTVDEIMVCRPKTASAHRATNPWNDLVLALRTIAKTHKMDQEAALIYIESNYDVFPGGLVTCPGWKEGIHPEGRIHSCGNISFVKEIYHNWMCPECLKAAKKFRTKGKVAASTAIRAHSVIRRLRFDR